MANWKLGKKRLLKLADHLESGKLGHKKFYFGAYNRDRYLDDPKPYSCGYMGCAIGECPIVFPRDWQFNAAAEPGLRNGGVHELYAAQDFFSIERDEASALFMPDWKRWWTDSTLPVSATRKQVARSIRQFVAWKDKAVEVNA